MKKRKSSPVVVCKIYEDTAFAVFDSQLLLFISQTKIRLKSPHNQPKTRLKTPQ